MKMQHLAIVVVIVLCLASCSVARVETKTDFGGTEILPGVPVNKVVIGEGVDCSCLQYKLRGSGDGWATIEKKGSGTTISFSRVTKAGINYLNKQAEEMGCKIKFYLYEKSNTLVVLPRL